MALHDELVRAGNQFNSIFSVELFDDFAAKEVAGAAGAHHPARNFIRVAPHQVAHGTIVRNFLLPVNLFNFVKGCYARRQTAVHTEDPRVNDGSQRKVVEDLRTVAPHVNGAVLAQAFVVEAVDLGDLSGLVVASNQRDALRVSNLDYELKHSVGNLL